MVKSSNPSSASAPRLTYSAFFEQQISEDEKSYALMRIAVVHRSRMTAHAAQGLVKLRLPPRMNTAGFAVGDWVVVNSETGELIRRLDRATLLQRQTEGTHAKQLIAANVDTLFIVTSCNDDFNHARLERYLALANEAGTTPVIVITKVDQVADPTPYLQKAESLQRGLVAVALNAKSGDAIAALAPWCGEGQTVALVGSSGVGKSTLLNTLAEKTGEAAQATGGIRETDAKGRHTTTSRSLHTMASGGWLIDTPGMRTLHVSDIAHGLDVLFAEITELAPECRFRDCTHANEPGCAVLAAVADGTLEADRLERWRKLVEENRDNTRVETGPRGNKIAKSRFKRR
ncbi:MAG: ribosome small subunit-dependent GTPase A [Pikeienuella sp.]